MNGYRLQFKLLLSIFIVCIYLFSACKKDEANQENETIDFSGSYMVDLTYEKFETYNNPDSNGYDPIIGTNVYEYNDTIHIVQIDNSDEFEVDGIYWYFTNNPVIAKAKNDSLVFDNDKSTDIRKHYSRGHFILKDKMLFVDYEWQNSDTWSYGAVPEYGSITGSGFKL